MKKIRRLKIRVITAGLLVAERDTDTQKDNRPTTESQMCPLCGQLIEPNHTLNLLAACADEHTTINEKEE